MTYNVSDKVINLPPIVPHRGRQVTSLTYLQILEQNAGVCTGANALAYRKKWPEKVQSFQKGFQCSLHFLVAYHSFKCR
jgi:hypothetical protein